jgi:hypothetical protein
MRLRRQIVRAFIRHEKSWIAFEMKEQRVEPQPASRNASKNRYALCFVEPLCNASRDRFEQASRNNGSRMNLQMEDDRAGRKSGLRQPLLFKGESIRLA